MSENIDYNDNKVQFVGEYCSECGEQLNETELTESETHIESDEVFCTTHLNKHLGIPV